MPDTSSLHYAQDPSPTLMEKLANREPVQDNACKRDRPPEVQRMIEAIDSELAGLKFACDDLVHETEACCIPEPPADKKAKDEDTSTHLGGVLSTFYQKIQQCRHIVAGVADRSELPLLNSKPEPARTS